MRFLGHLTARVSKPPPRCRSRQHSEATAIPEEDLDAVDASANEHEEMSLEKVHPEARANERGQAGPHGECCDDGPSTRAACPPRSGLYGRIGLLRRAPSNECSSPLVMVCCPASGC